MECRDTLRKMILRLGPIFLTILAASSVFIALIYNLVRIDQFQYSHPPIQFEKEIINDQPNGLIWFLQISDLHLSQLGHESRRTDLLQFATEYVSTVRPSAVLVTGDITDGRGFKFFETGQQLKEWQAYQDVITRSEVLNKTSWLDIRGNHDNLNVYRPRDESALYRRYSVKGRENARNYMHVLEKDGRNYSFIGVDGVQTPGIRIPFNFIGVLHDEDIKELQSLSKQSNDIYNSDYKIWFGHYPTSSIASPYTGIRSLVDGPYLCGHFHTTGGLANKMHATQQAGYVELELADWKNNRRLRLAAIDHQLFSSVDVTFNEWPVALMTNPKPAEQLMPKFEPVDRIFNSTHIRVIAFSTAKIEQVLIKIDEEPSWRNMNHVDGPLYVLEWSPIEYGHGLHIARVAVSDAKGRNRDYSHQFSIDGSHPDFAFMARILIRVPITVYIMSMFLFLVFLSVVPIIMFNLLQRQGSHLSVKRNYGGTMLYKLYVLANIKCLAIPLGIIPIWCAIGPLFVGKMVDDVIGVCFTWGILVDGTFLHTSNTFTVASVYMIFIHIPIHLLLANQVNARHKEISRHSSRNTVTASSVFSVRFMTWLIITTLQFLLGFAFSGAYGYLVSLTSFMFTWSIAIYSYCWYKALRLQLNDFELSRTKYREPNSNIPVEASLSSTVEN